MNRQDQFRGCLLGGAAGDALGYEVEFVNAETIFRRYGYPGIREYEYHYGYAQISDDTQMTMFTVAGLLHAACAKPEAPRYADGILAAYQDWLHTQMSFYDGEATAYASWLGNVRSLYARRAPGNTCLSALMIGGWGTPENPINQSKGCGGVMRVAPIGLYMAGREDCTAALADRVGAEAAALTHGHELGYIPSAALVHIIYRLIEQPEMTIAGAVDDAIAALQEQYGDSQHLPRQLQLLEQAKELAKSGQRDVDAIHALGGGWTGEDALAIAVYCALKYPGDFDGAMIAAVNHSGDSDSTGAIAGNILGTKLGMAGIPEKYLAGLELKNILLELADDLYLGCSTPTAALMEDPIWREKYLMGTHMPKPEDDQLDAYDD